MKDNDFLRKFGLPQEIIEKTITVSTKDNYLWIAEHDGDNVNVYCSTDRETLYDGNDKTLADKIITDKNLFFRNPKIDHILIAEEYVKTHGDGEVGYVVTSLKDSACMYEK